MTVRMECASARETTSCCGYAGATAGSIRATASDFSSSIWTRQVTTGLSILDGWLAVCSAVTPRLLGELRLLHLRCSLRSPIFSRFALSRLLGGGHFIAAPTAEAYSHDHVARCAQTFASRMQRGFSACTQSAMVPMPEAPMYKDDGCS